MNSLSAKCRRHKEVGLGRPPHPFERADVIVDVIGHDEYVIDLNTWDIVEGDKVTVKFFFDETWDMHTDRKCAVLIDDRVEVFELVDDQFTIPRHLIVNCDVRLTLMGYHNPLILKGLTCRDGRFIAGDVDDSGISKKVRGRHLATDGKTDGERRTWVIKATNGHLVVTDKIVRMVPEEFDNPYSEDNKLGYIELDMSAKPIKIGSWYDR